MPWLRGPASWPLLAILLAVLPLGIARAQSASLAFRGENGEQIVKVRATMSGGSRQGHGLGFVRFDLDNVDSRPHEVGIELFLPRRRTAGVTTRKSLILEPGKARLFLPVAVPPVRCQIQVTVDGLTMMTSINSRVGDGVVGLVVSDQPGAEPLGLQVLQAMPTSDSHATPKPVMMGTRDLPTDWRLLTSFSTIVVDGRSPMSGDLQDAVCRYAFSGGTVVVASPDALPAGSLRDRASDASNATGQHGFGHILAIGSLGGDPSSAARKLAELPKLGSGLWPADPRLFETQFIKGLGEAPVTAFVLVILLFAILVGPVNFWVLRRKKKPLLALLTVPLAGFGTTIAILAYGIFNDGFGVRGSMRSWTILDQANHEAVSVSAHTLFAGLAPSDLTMKADSMILSQRAGRGRDYPDRWDWDANRERLDGGVLPSRTVTPLLSVRQRAARQRLTLRPSGDTLEVLADGVLDPVGETVLRDLEGTYWAGSDGVLQRVSREDGRKRFRRLLMAASTIDVAERGGSRQGILPPILSNWGGRGTYATCVAAAPWLDDHGLTVAYDHQSHFLFGRLHAQDFVR